MARGVSAPYIPCKPRKYAGEESSTRPDGLIIKRGTVTATTAGAAVVFADAFNTVLCAFLQKHDMDGNANDDLVVNGLTVNGFTATAFNTNNQTAYWFAMGY